MKSLSFLLMATTAFAGKIHLVGRADPSVKPGYTNTFFDSFSGAAGSLPSSTNWIIDTGTSYPGGAAGWGNGEAETYTSSTTNLQVTSAGTLTITPRKVNGAWTSGKIESQRTDFLAAAGKKLYVEASIKLGTAAASQQQGIWPAFWALGSAFRGVYTNWPAASEWDFLESINGAPTFYSTIHCGVAPGGPCNEYNGIGSGGVGFSKGTFHTVGFEVDRTASTWTAESLNWYLNGAKVFTVTGAKVNDQTAWENLAHKPHFLLLNVAVGGSWPGAPNAATVDGAAVQMEVDYVGVWNSS